MGRPKPIEWPNKAKICVTFIVPWEVWPENFATRESLQRSSHRVPPANAVFKRNMAAVTEREYGDRVGIFRLLEMLHSHGIAPSVAATIRDEAIVRIVVNGMRFILLSSDLPAKSGVKFGKRVNSGNIYWRRKRRIPQRGWREDD